MSDLSTLLAVHHRKQKLSCGGGGGGEFQKEQTNDSSKITLCLYESHLRVVQQFGVQYSNIFHTTIFFKLHSFYVICVLIAGFFQLGYINKKNYGPRYLLLLPRCLPFLGRMAQKFCCSLFLPRCLRSQARFNLPFRACGFREAQWSRARSRRLNLQRPEEGEQPPILRERLRYTQPSATYTTRYLAQPRAEMYAPSSLLINVQSMYVIIFASTVAWCMIVYLVHCCSRYTSDRYSRTKVFEQSRQQCLRAQPTCGIFTVTGCGSSPFAL